MTTDNTPDIDERVLAGLTGPKKLRLLIEQKCGTMADWAREEGLDAIALHHCLAGRRESPVYRQRLAESLGLERETVDAMIEEGKEAASAT